MSEDKVIALKNPAPVADALTEVLREAENGEHPEEARAMVSGALSR